jgi:hypothetical protein
LGAANCLILKKLIKLPSNCIKAGVVTIDELTNVLAEKILTNHTSKEESHHHINEVMKIFPNLQFGMDVNPKFTNGPTGVEYTMELNAFDLLHIELVHGWLLEPDAQEYEYVQNLTYNQCINLVIQGNDASAILCDENNDNDTNEQHKQTPKNEDNYDELSTQATVGSIIHHFLERSSHQLTQYGLMVLHEYVKEGDMVVFFRNNHFNTLTKHTDGHLYLLVTDFGYADVSSVVWEKLDVIDGDTEYVTGDFTVPPPIEHQHISGAATGEQLVANNLQSNSDYQLALQLSRETELDQRQLSATTTTATGTSTSREQKEEQDIELARQASLLEHQQQQQQQLLQVGGNGAVNIPLAASTTKALPSSATPQTMQSQSTNTTTTMPTVAVGIPATNLSQEDRDMVLAMQLQRQEEQQRQAAMAVSDGDEASRQLALALQEEERARQQRYASRPAPPPGRQPITPSRAQAGGGGGGKDSNGCIVC